MTPKQLGLVLQILLYLASVGVWTWIAWMRFRRRAVCPAVHQERLTWDHLAVGLAICGAHLVPFLLVGMLGGTTKDAVRNVQLLCLANLVRGTVLLLAFLPPRVLDKLGWRFSWLDARLAALMFLASLLPVYALNLSVELLKWRTPDGVHELLKLLKEQPTSSLIFWVGVSVMIAAPIVEELMYRVVIQGWLESLISPVPAILAVAILFASAHGRPGQPDHIPLFAFALVLGYLYHRSRSFPAVVLVHSLFNGMNLGLALLINSG